MNNLYPPDTASAPYYDLIYSFNDYAGEAEALSRLIQSELPGAKTVLDVACGTHEHARYLIKFFSVDGLDINREFLRVAQGKNPDGRYAWANMRDFELGRRYDIVTCLSSSIGYLRDIAELDQTLSCFERHLNPGGVIIVEPWFTPETWQPGKISIVIGETDSLKIVRASIRRMTNRGSLMSFHYMLVAKPDRVETFREDHHMALFTLDEIRSSFGRLNFNVTHLPWWSSGRGLFIAKRLGRSKWNDRTTGLASQALALSGADGNTGLLRQELCRSRLHPYQDKACGEMTHPGI